MALSPQAKAKIQRKAQAKKRVPDGGKARGRWPRPGGR